MSASKGYVYILTNSSFNYLKIGASINHPTERAKQLSASTSSPTPFVVAYHRHVSMPFEVEAEIHEQLSDCRINDSREFFDISLKQATSILEQYPALRKKDVRDMKLPWSELFASFSDDGSARELTTEERTKCRALAGKLNG